MKMMLSEVGAFQTRADPLKSYLKGPAYGQCEAGLYGSFSGRGIDGAR